MGTANGAGATSDANALQPSCALGRPGMSDCGTSRESCCVSLEVVGGTYYRTYDDTSADGGVLLPLDGGPAGEADPATVSSFRLDKYAVTVARFRQFVSAWSGGYTPRAGAGKHTHLNGGNGLAATAGGYEPGWVESDNVQISPTDANLACSPVSTWTALADSQENLPINCVTWYESYAFCIWDGGFLPSEAEWEYAAAGGDQQREYPWGSAAPGTANEYAIYGFYYTCTLGTCTGAAAQIAPVGVTPEGVGRWGQLDLAGNVWQWNLDWNAAYVQCTDCAEVTPFGDRVSRGGYFRGSSSYLRVPWRGGGPPTYRGEGLGFRCARSP
jgi:formylglycine-generating enzyme required for sulfatase activity